MTTENDLKAARQCAKYWARRYQAAQALIAELQGERDDAIQSGVSWRYLSKYWWDTSNRFMSERDELAAGIHRRDARIAELEGRLQAARDNQPGAGLLGPYTPTPDPIQGVEDMYFTGESWQTEDE